MIVQAPDGIIEFSLDPIEAPRMVGVHHRVLVKDGPKGCETLSHLAPGVLETSRDHRGELVERDAVGHVLIVT